MKPTREHGETRNLQNVNKPFEMGEFSEAVLHFVGHRACVGELIDEANNQKSWPLDLF